MQSPKAPGTEVLANEPERADPALPKNKTRTPVAGHL